MAKPALSEILDSFMGLFKLRTSKQFICLSILTVALCSGCASNKQSQAQAQQASTGADASLETNSTDDKNGISDPFEPVNRVMWDFNYEVLDKYLLKPVTQGYVAITPQPVRNGLVNAANNIEEPANAINNLLQGKGKSSITSVARFAVNTTVGILGIFDVATSMGLEREREDFGQVLGVWGVGTGPYLMLPGLGPSDFRSFTGDFVDNYYWPATVLEDPYVIGAAVVSLLEARASLMEQEETLNRALDQYLFVRDAYFQRLAFEVSDGKIEQKSEEEIEEEEDDFSDFEDLLNGMD